jgi:hypothetical protein
MAAQIFSSGPRPVIKRGRVRSETRPKAVRAAVSSAFRTGRGLASGRESLGAPKMKQADGDGVQKLCRRCQWRLHPSRLLRFRRALIGPPEACSWRTCRILPAIIRPEYKMIPIFGLCGVTYQQQLLITRIPLARARPKSPPPCQRLCQLNHERREEMARYGVLGLAVPCRRRLDLRS